ncbi:MAG: hypothetical protein IT427_10880 [Pirellulales bacterium]|nr:hypothetical protein [Pirellulales bacterium]
MRMRQNAGTRFTLDWPLLSLNAMLVIDECERQGGGMTGKSWPKHRWLRFSLRALLIVVTIVWLATGWVVEKLNWKKARHEVLKLGSTEPIYAAKNEDRCNAQTSPGHWRLIGE